ncbi:SRPBCC family protein [Gordonia sp. NPDC003425]
MTIHPSPLADIGEQAAGIDGLMRIETHPRSVATPVIVDMLRSVYPHDRIYGDFCPVQGYVDAPPAELFEWLSDTRSLEEWTYSLRGFAETEEPGLWVAKDMLGDDTDIYTRTIAHPESMTVDYHCAWDQGAHLWMIYLMRVVDAQIVLDKPGSVVLWTNCRHPFYDRNPYPETAPAGRPVWVGDFWDMFSAGHQLELNNLTAIAEFRHAHGLPLTPDWMKR